MAHHHLIDGYIISFSADQEGLAWIAETWDDDDEAHAGRSRLSSGPSTNLSFRCPEPHVKMIEYAARISGLGKSAFIRDAVMEKAAKIISIQQAKDAFLAQL